MPSFPFLPGALLAVLLAAAPLRAESLPPPFADASRLVSIGGSLTEIVYALGEGERLVARDTTSTFPPEAEALPHVGYMRALSPEGVLSVAPSAILALEGSGPPETMEVLRKASVPMVIVPETHDRQGILRKIRFVGAALGAAEKAQELAVTVERDIAAAERLTAGIDERKRVLFILSMQGGRLLVAGRGTAAAGIIAMAGAVNAIDAFSGYKQVSEEAVSEARPDVILMMTRGGDNGADDAALFSHPAIAATPAAHQRAVVRMEGGYLLGFGPRTASAVRELAGALYGRLAAN